MTKCRLVMIEWEDSAQPMSNWAYLSALDTSAAVRCVSVGWLVHDGKDAKALAPNIGNLDEEDALQVSGTIRIPTRCIIRQMELDEPELTRACEVVTFAAPSSRPETEPKQQAS